MAHNALAGMMVLAVATLSAALAAAQTAGGGGPASTGSLQTLVAPVALYPDDLLAIVLSAATRPQQIAAAGRMLDTLDANVPAAADEAWHGSVVALLNYPEVVSRLNADPAWTRELGAAVASREAAVIDAVSRFRGRAYTAGLLRSDDRLRVRIEDDMIRIVPAHPEVLYVPDYDPDTLLHPGSDDRYGYLPRPYPVYYHPYGDGHYLTRDRFWGLTSAFSISWQNRAVELRWLGQGRPYYGREYDPRYDRDYLRWGALRYGTRYDGLSTEPPPIPPLAPAGARPPRLAAPPRAAPDGAPRLYGGRPSPGPAGQAP